MHVAGRGQTSRPQSPAPAPRTPVHSRAASLGPSLLGFDTGPREWMQAWCRGKKTPPDPPWPLG